jgi:hypothetical protein
LGTGAATLALFPLEHLQAHSLSSSAQADDPVFADPRNAIHAVIAGLDPAIHRASHKFLQRMMTPRDRLPVRHRQLDARQCAALGRGAQAHEIRGELQSKVIAEMIKSLSSGVPKERAVEKAFKAGAYWWHIGEHFGMSQQTAYETVKRAKKKRARK